MMSENTKKFRYSSFSRNEPAYLEGRFIYRKSHTKFILKQEALATKRKWETRTSSTLGTAPQDQTNERGPLGFLFLCGSWAPSSYNETAALFSHSLYGQTWYMAPHFLRKKHALLLKLFTSVHLKKLLQQPNSILRMDCVALFWADISFVKTYAYLGVTSLCW
jgi:hypothetical protein